METENAKRKCDEENDSTQCNGEDDSKFSHQFLESQESKTAEEAYVLSLRSIQKDFLKGLGATAKFHDFFKKLIIVFQSKHPEQSIPEDVQKKWVAITRNIVLGPVPSRRARVDKTPRTAADLQYTTRATQIYYLIKQPIDRFNSSIPGYKKSSKRKKVISGTSAENAEHGNEEEEEPMQEEQEKSPQPLPLCVIEQPIISGDEFPRIVGTGGVLARVAAEMSFNHLRGGFGKTSFSDDEGGPETEEEIQIRGVGVYEESGSSTEEQHRPHDIGDETAELNSTDIQSQHDSDEASSSDEHSLKPSVGARPQREKKEIDRFGTHTKHNEIKPRHVRRRKTAIVSSKKKLRGNEGEEAPMSLREELEEVRVVDSVQMVHLKNVGVVVVPFERPSEQLPALEEAVMVPFGVHNTTLAKNYNADKSSRCLRPPLSTMFSTSSSPQIQGFPKGAYCRVIRNTNKINLNVDIFLQSIHTFDTFSVIASQMCEDEPADIPKYVACATSYLEPTYARRYQLSRGDMLFADARMLLRVTEDTVLYFKSPHQYEECTVALCDGTTPLDEDLLFNYPGDCEDTDFFLHDNTLVEMALLQYLFRTSNLVDDHMRWGLTSKYVNVVRKAMTETVVRYSTLQRFQHLDNVTNFVEAEILRKLCVDSLAELNPKFESLSVWSMRMLVLACLYAKSTFFAEVWWFGNMDWALKDAVRSLCLASKQSASLDVNSVRMEDLLSYSKTAANDSIQEFIRAVGNASSCAGNDYVALDQMDFTSLGRQLKTDLKSYQTANQLKCTCREKCGRECVNWKSSILCTQANCCLMTRSPQTTCGNALQDLPTPELVVRNCDDAFIGKELAAGDLGFEVGQFVCQYLGVVVTSTEQMDWEGNHYTILCNMQSSPVTWPRYVYVNAKDKGTVARHANHSDNPNCVMVVWNMAETPLPILFARRDILPGEAITFHYRGKSIDFFGLGGCLCKSVLCKNHVSRKGLTELEMLVQTSYEKQFARSTCCSLSTIPDLKQKKMRASPPPSQSVQPLSPPENEKAHKVMSIAPRGTTVLPGLITPAEEPNLSRQRDQELRCCCGCDKVVTNKRGHVCIACDKAVFTPFSCFFLHDEEKTGNSGTCIPCSGKQNSDGTLQSASPAIGGVDDITVMGNANTATKCGVDKIFWKNDHESQSDCLGEIRVAKITRNSPVDRNLRLSFADVSFGQGDGVVDLTSRKIFSMFHRSSSVKEGVPLMSATVIAKGEWGEGNYSIQDVSIPPPSPPAAALPPSSAAPPPRCNSQSENIKEFLPVFVACILTFTARLHLKTHDVLPGDEFSYHYFIYSEDELLEHALISLPCGCSTLRRFQVSDDLNHMEIRDKRMTIRDWFYVPERR